MSNVFTEHEQGIVFVTRAMYVRAASRISKSLVEGFRTYGTPVDDQRKWSLLLGGLIAEEAVAVVFCTRTANERRPDGGIDLVIGQGERVQVKWNDRDAGSAHFYSRPDLIANFDIGILVARGPREHTVQMAGWIDRAGYEAKKHPYRYHRDNGNEVEIVTADEMYPIWQLIQTRAP